MAVLTCPACSQPLPRPLCVCGHAEASHDLRGIGTLTFKRFGCSAHSGPQGRPCGCEKWQPEEGR